VLAGHGVASAEAYQQRQGVRRQLRMAQILAVRMPRNAAQRTFRPKRMSYVAALVSLLKQVKAAANVRNAQK
jgi:hypothetical protein